MSGNADILVFSPHPDDAELGCAGSIILSSQKGLKVVVADLSEGENSSSGTSSERLLSKQKAGEMLGLCNRVSLNLPDTQIGAEWDHILPVIKAIRETRPAIVLAPFLHDRHPDHTAASKLVSEAFFMSGVRRVGEGTAYRPARLFYYSLHYQTAQFIPSFVMDISSVWQKKMETLKCYGSQIVYSGKGVKTALNNPDFLRFIEIKAAWYGAMIGVKYGEGFCSNGPVPISDFSVIFPHTNNTDEFPSFSTF